MDSRFGFDATRWTPPSSDDHDRLLAAFNEWESTADELSRLLGDHAQGRPVDLCHLRQTIELLSQRQATWDALARQVQPPLVK